MYFSENVLNCFCSFADGLNMIPLATLCRCRGTGSPRIMNSRSVFVVVLDDNNSAIKSWCSVCCESDCASVIEFMCSDDEREEERHGRDVDDDVAVKLLTRG